MIAENTVKKINVVLILFVFFTLGFGNLSVQGQAEQCACDAGVPVKYEWNKNALVFELAEGDDEGISIIDVELDDEDEPRCVTWHSTTNFITQACVKAGNNTPYSEYYNINDYDPNVGQTEEICTPYQQAISNFVLCVDGPLPVEMTSFSVNINNNLAELSWETATEVNNYGFEVQRATEQLDWAKVGFIQGHGNSNSPKHYSFTDVSVNKSGKYYFRLKQIDIDGQFEYSDVVEIDFSAPMDYKLNQNYPNPFNPTTTINFTLPEQTNVKLTIYNVFGEEVTRLVNDVKDAGTHNIVFNAKNLASGMYYYTLETENYVATKKLILLK